MSGFHIDQPEQLRRELFEIDWGFVSFGGQVSLRICPMCQATVPLEFNNTTEITPRMVHIDYHVAAARLLKPPRPLPYP